jgi:hypothetical protein
LPPLRLAVLVRRVELRDAEDVARAGAFLARDGEPAEPDDDGRGDDERDEVLAREVVPAARDEDERDADAELLPREAAPVEREDEDLARDAEPVERAGEAELLARVDEPVEREDEVELFARGDEAVEREEGAAALLRDEVPLLERDEDDEDLLRDDDFASPVAARCLLTALAAISLARFGERPSPSSLSFTCSYWRSRFALHAFCGIFAYLLFDVPARTCAHGVQFRHRCREPS